MLENNTVYFFKHSRNPAYAKEKGILRSAWPDRDLTTYLDTSDYGFGYSRLI